MYGIKNALKFLWGVIFGMTIVQICYSPTAGIDGEVTNFLSLFSYLLIVTTGIALFVISLGWFVDHWNDDKRK